MDASYHPLIVNHRLILLSFSWAFHDCSVSCTMKTSPELRSVQTSATCCLWRCCLPRTMSVCRMKNLKSTIGYSWNNWRYESITLDFIAINMKASSQFTSSFQQTRPGPRFQPTTAPVAIWRKHCWTECVSSKQRDAIVSWHFVAIYTMSSKTTHVSIQRQGFVPVIEKNFVAITCVMSVATSAWITQKSYVIVIERQCCHLSIASRPFRDAKMWTTSFLFPYWIARELEKLQKNYLCQTEPDAKCIQRLCHVLQQFW